MIKNKKKEFFGSINLRIIEIRERLKSISVKGSFAQNFSLTFSGNIFSIILSLIFAPIMSRIYYPESYGTFSIYMALIVNVSSFALLSYNVALILPKEVEKFNNLLRLAFLLTLIFSSIVLMLTILFTEQIFQLFSIKSIRGLIYLVAPSIFFICTATILSQWLTRDKEFKKLTITNGINNFSTRTLTITLGYFLNGNVFGFILGDIFSRLFAVLLLLNKKIWFGIKALLEGFKLSEIVSIAKEFKKYPLLVLPGEYINLLSGQLPFYLIAIYFNNQELGYFAFASSILDMPMSLFGNSVRPVFFQKASSIYNEDKNRLGNITTDLFKYLFIIGIIPFSVLTIFGDVIFGFIFGLRWTQAGLFAGILGYYYIFKLISSPISSVLWVVKKEKTFLIFQISLFATRLISLLIGIYFFNDLIITLILFSIANTINYLVLTVLVLKILNVNYVKVISQTIMLIIGIFTFLHLVRFELNNIFK